MIAGIFTLFFKSFDIIIAAKNMHEIEIETVEKSLKDKIHKTYYNVEISNFINHHK